MMAEMPKYHCTCPISRGVKFVLWSVITSYFGEQLDESMDDLGCGDESQ